MSEIDELMKQKAAHQQEEFEREMDEVQTSTTERVEDDGNWSVRACGDRACGDRASGEGEGVASPVPMAKLDEDELREEFQNCIDDLIGHSLYEKGGEVVKNAYRLYKGRDLHRLEGIAKRLYSLGDEDARNYVAFARAEYETRLRNRGVTDAKQRLSETEVSVTRKAYRAWCLPFNDMETKFKLIDEVNPETGQPLVSDNGEPYEYDVSSVATNSLYALADYVKPDNFERLASIAYRYSEKLCIKLGKTLRKNERNTKHIIDYVANAHMDEDALGTYLDKLLGTNDTSIASIKVAREFYEGAYADVRDIATDIYKRHSLPLDDKGYIPATVLLERIFIYFAGKPRAVASILVDASDITLEQAKAYVDSLS